MKLRVRNFGPVREADVEIKPMTIFVGPGNTGKSYLAMLAYAIAKTLKDAQRNMMHAVYRYFGRTFRELPEKETALSVINDVQKLMPIAAEAANVFARAFRENWNTEAQRCFGEEWENIVAQNGDFPVSLSVANNGGVVLDLLASKPDILPDKKIIAERIKKEIEASMEMERQEEGHLDYWMDANNAEEECTLALLGSFSFLPHTSRSSRAHYLPAIRGGVMQSHRTLVSALIEKAPEIGITGADIVPFTGVLADFLRKLLNVGDVRKKRRAGVNREGLYTGGLFRKNADSGVANLSRKIEQEILHGEIGIKMSETGYPDFRYRFSGAGDRDRDIPLVNASSSVSELAPIILFVRYYLSSGDVFIVEEPEAHLHPAAQRIVASVLAELVNAGVYVIATTHSDVVLEQLSNHIHAHGVPASKTVNVLGDVKLAPEKTAVYHFPEEHQGRTKVKLFPPDKNTGIVTPDHLDSSSELYNEAVDLLNAKRND